MGAPSADLEVGGGGVKGELSSAALSGSDASSGGSRSMVESAAEDAACGQDSRACGDASRAAGDSASASGSASSASSASTAASPARLPMSSSHLLRPTPSQGQLNKSGQFVLGSLRGYTAPFLSRVVVVPDDPGRSYELDEASERHLLFNAPSGLELTESMLCGMGGEGLGGGGNAAASSSSGGVAGVANAGTRARMSTGSGVTYVQYATKGEGEEVVELKERKCCGRPVRIHFRALVQAIFVSFLVATVVVLLAPLLTAYAHTIDEVADTCSSAAVEGARAFANLTKGLELSIQMLASVSGTSVLRQLMYSVPHTVNGLWNAQWYSAAMLPEGADSSAMGTYAAAAPALPGELNLTLWTRSAGSVMINLSKLGTQASIFKVGYTTARQAIQVAFGRELPGAAQVAKDLRGGDRGGIAGMGQYHVSAGTAALFFIGNQSVESALAYPIDIHSWKPDPAKGTAVNTSSVNYELLSAPLTRQQKWAANTTNKTELVGLWSNMFKSVGPSTVFPGPTSPEPGDLQECFCYSFSWPWARCADGKESYACLAGAFSAFFSSDGFSLYTNSVLISSMNAYRPLERWVNNGVVQLMLDDNGFPVYVANTSAAEAQKEELKISNATAFAQIVNSSAIFHITISAPVRNDARQIQGAPALFCPAFRVPEY
jgi:hypothetical protein